MNKSFQPNFSLFSSIDRYNLPYSFNKLDIIKQSNSLVNFINDEHESGYLEKPIYNDFDHLEYFNYVPLDILKPIIIDLFIDYVNDFPNGNTNSFIENKFGWFIYEIKKFKEILYNERFEIWQNKEGFEIYGFSEFNIRGYNFFFWSSKSQDSVHFYLLYIDAVLHFFEKELGKPDIKENPKDLVKKERAEKSFSDFIFNVNDKELFIEELIEIFKTEIGIPLKILIELLKDENILLIGDREFKQFHSCLNKSFNRDIGSYQALNDSYKHKKEDKEYRKKDIELIYIKLNPLLTIHKIN